MAAIARTINPCGQTEAFGNDRDLWKGLEGYAREISVRDIVEDFHFSDVGLNVYTINFVKA
jgi:hypothetical protein